MRNEKVGKWEVGLKGLGTRLGTAGTKGLSGGGLKFDF
jgi:hypothetical protein